MSSSTSSYFCEKMVLTFRRGIRVLYSPVSGSVGRPPYPSECLAQPTVRVGVTPDDGTRPAKKVGTEVCGGYVSSPGKMCPDFSCERSSRLTANKFVAMYSVSRVDILGESFGRRVPSFQTMPQLLFLPRRPLVCPPELPFSVVLFL